MSLLSFEVGNFAGESVKWDKEKSRLAFGHLMFEMIIMYPGEMSLGKLEIKSWNYWEQSSLEMQS